MAEEEKTRSLDRPARRRRPRLGLALLGLGGLFIIWMPLVLYLKEFAHFSMAFGGVVIGLVVLGSAVLGWIYPSRVQVFGAVGLVFSILSLMGAFGGLIIGMLLGITGGCLCIAWGPRPEGSTHNRKKKGRIRRLLSRTENP
ncbi:DUF6114 domain-containing protein [Rubrobacter naiadicus]|uniref:DUF6114 domain-containing protein n=1 Tax=Rubrobacter naiadicus TaxID=1392641 RepID=UPI0023620F89|nr:DUF6114 domain-containing protein [Rubrobacter naiadicus]